MAKTSATIYEDLVGMWTVTYGDMEFSGTAKSMASHMGFLMQQLAQAKAVIDKAKATAAKVLAGDPFTLSPNRRTQILKAAHAATDRGDPIGAECRSLLGTITHLECVLGVELNDMAALIKVTTAAAKNKDAPDGKATNTL